MYHRLGAGRLAGREEGEEVYAVSPEDFEAHLDALEKCAAQVVDPASLQALSAGWTGWTHPAVCLTFDDGNWSDHALALPALRRRGWRALFFVVPAWVGRPGYLGWSEVRELGREGMGIGAHGLDHARLGRLSDDELRHQLREARRLLGAELGAPPAALSLPGGSGGRRAVHSALAEGYTLVATSEPELARAGAGTAPLPRFALRRSDSPETVRALAEQRAGVIWRWKVRHRLLRATRALVGEGRYARVRALWARGTGKSRDGARRDP
jgi:peptidoglycan/xylan/chitin deacetylase (PgdA/CDA1 family)